MNKLLYLFLIIWLPLHSLAWGKKGHQIVAQIAMLHISKAAYNNLMMVLGNTSVEDAATWMDDVRNNHSYDFMKPWHYINVDKDAVYPDKTEENVVTELTAAYLELKHPQTLTPEQIKEKVMMLFHLAGDLHQPLHTGYADDRGGNSIQLQFNGKGTNLHSLWDEGIIDQQHITFTSVRDSRPPFDEASLKLVADIDIVAWMRESRALLPKVYDFKGSTISETYAAKNKDVIEQQLLFAGIRLASLLDDVLKNAALSKVIAVPDNGQSSLEPETPNGTISAKDAVNYKGQEVTVCTHVYSATYKKKSKTGPTLLNVGTPLPGSPLTIVIYRKDRDNFSYAPETYLAGKNICVYGKVVLYRGKPEIIVTRPEDLKVQP